MYILDIRYELYSLSIFGCPRSANSQCPWGDLSRLFLRLWFQTAGWKFRHWQVRRGQGWQKKLANLTGSPCSSITGLFWVFLTRLISEIGRSYIWFKTLYDSLRPFHPFFVLCFFWFLRWFSRGSQAPESLRSKVRAWTGFCWQWRLLRALVQLPWVNYDKYELWTIGHHWTVSNMWDLASWQFNVNYLLSYL